jgi:hypothetical protein
MRKLFVISGILFFVTSSALADFDKTAWEYKKGINDPGSAGFVLLNLDEDVFNHASDNLSDLRVVDGSGTEVPYTIAAEGDRSETSSISARLFNKSFVPGESTVFTLDLGEAGKFHNRVIIHANSENFRRMVEIEGGDDGVSWRFLTRQGQIYNYTVRDEIKPVSISDTTVIYPESTSRYLRVRILDRGEAPLSISGASVVRALQVAARETKFNPSVTITQNTQNRATEIEADLGVRGIPTRKVRLDISDANFNRQVDILSSNDSGSNWKFISSNYIFRVNTEKFSGENTTLFYPEVQTRYLKFVIFNRDDQPLRAANVELFGILRKLVFNYSQGNSYTLYYGNQKARRPEYDIERLFPYLDTGKMNQTSLAREEKNTDFKLPEPPPVPLTERNPYVLPVALGIIVAILAFLLLRLFAKIKPQTSQSL